MENTQSPIAQVMPLLNILNNQWLNKFKDEHIAAVTVQSVHLLLANQQLPQQQLNKHRLCSEHALRSFRRSKDRKACSLIQGFYHCLIGAQLVKSLLEYQQFEKPYTRPLPGSSAPLRTAQTVQRTCQ